MAYLNVVRLCQYSNGPHRFDDLPHRVAIPRRGVVEDAARVRRERRGGNRRRRLRDRRGVPEANLLARRRTELDAVRRAELHGHGRAAVAVRVVHVPVVAEEAALDPNRVGVGDAGVPARSGGAIDDKGGRVGDDAAARRGRVGDGSEEVRVGVSRLGGAAAEVDGGRRLVDGAIVVGAAAARVGGGDDEALVVRRRRCVHEERAA